jgi:hypothetical protein
MTYQEYISKTLSRFQVTPDDVELLLINQKALIPSKDAEVDPLTAKKAIAAEFGSLIPLANISEGGYSISWKWDAIKLWYHSLCNEIGIDPVSEKSKPTIQNMSDLW